MSDPTPEQVAKVQRYKVLCADEEARHPRFSEMIRCDQVCFMYLQGGDDVRTEFEHQVLSQAANATAFSRWNSTSIGNMCFIEACTENVQVREKCTAMRNAYFAWSKTPPVEKCVIC